MSNPLETETDRQARKEAWLDEQAVREREEAAWAATAQTRALTAALAAGGYGGAPAASGEALKVESLDTTMQLVTFDTETILKKPKLDFTPEQVKAAMDKVWLDIERQTFKPFEVNYHLPRMIGIAGVIGEAEGAEAEAVSRVTVPMWFYSHARRTTMAQVLPNGLVIPAGSYIRPGRVTCGFCDGGIGRCKCPPKDADVVRESKHIDVVEAVDQTPAQVTDAVHKLLDGHRPKEGACYTCARPKNVSYPHKGTGIRYCLPCAEASLRNTI